MVRLWTRFMLSAIVLAGTCSVVGEQNETPAQREVSSAESKKLLEEVLLARLTRELALDEGQTVLLVRHMAEFRDHVAALRRQRAEKMRTLRQAVREGKDEKQLETLLEEVLALNEKSAAARGEILDIEGIELTTWQRARLVIFLNDFENDMKRLLRRAQERRESGQKGREKLGETPEKNNRNGAEGKPDPDSNESVAGAE